eukprot:TRINITY_DN7364_c0_g3_i2.p1 TRINITY_DN7364_c0_g3~~TRINITY_DN7364_c0_g3_i2.p1  ORF type:complete len:107 (-),score=21.30 TRINITY_DN7364_c0_g3_i2:129-449(-)
MDPNFRYFSIKRLQPEEAESMIAQWELECKSQRSYNVTSDEQRSVMLQQVTSNQMTISEAARKYGIKYTTAKHILNIFLREGRVEKKKRRLRKKPRKRAVQAPASL